jgi:hypothetical protein
MKNKPLLIFLGVFLIIILLCSCCCFISTLSSGNTNTSTNTKTSNITPTSSPLPSIPVTEKTLEFTIEKTSIIRFDGATSYFVLIPEVDVTTDVFKSEIELIISTIRKDKGNKISIEIFDNSESLELSYEREVNLKMVPADKNELVSRHYIAGFSGELSTDFYKNTLYYFPAAFKDNAEVGKWVDIIELSF